MRINSNSLTESVYRLYQKNQSSPQETTFNDLLRSAAGDIQNAAEPKIQIWNDYQAWKAQQPKRTLPNSKGATEENIAYLRENFTGELSLYQRIEAVDTMREMGIITEEQMRNAIGIGPLSLKVVHPDDPAIVVTGPAGDRNLEAWSSFFHGLPLMEATDLDALFEMVDNQLRFTKAGDAAEEIKAVLDRTTHRIPE